MFEIHFKRIAGAILLAVAFGTGYRAGEARETLPLAITPLFSTSETILGEPVTYPAGKAKLTGALIGMMPGQQTGWHTHGVPLAGMVLEGELTVDYGEKGKRTYKAGQALVESMGTPHNGSNTGTGPMKLFAIYIGAEGVPNSVPVTTAPAPTSAAAPAASEPEPASAPAKN